jgi:hypothetical protein
MKQNNTFERFVQALTDHEIEGSENISKTSENTSKTSENNNSTMRTFETGATRHTDDGKLDYEGFLSPRVLQRYAQYLNEHRIQADGNVRASDNWQKGIPQTVYFKSLLRHTFEAWKLHRRRQETFALSSLVLEIQREQEDALCAIVFNAMGYLFELGRDKE